MARGRDAPWCSAQQPPAVFRSPDAQRTALLWWGAAPQGSLGHSTKPNGRRGPERQGCGGQVWPRLSFLLGSGRGRASPCQRRLLSPPGCSCTGLFGNEFCHLCPGVLVLLREKHQAGCGAGGGVCARIWFPAWHPRWHGHCARALWAWPDVCGQCVWPACVHRSASPQRAAPSAGFSVSSCLRTRTVLSGLAGRPGLRALPAPVPAQNIPVPSPPTGTFR